MRPPDTDAEATRPRKSRYGQRPTWRDRRLQRLAARLPGRIRVAIHVMRQPSARWVRMPSGILLMIGGVVLTPLPAFVAWMIPVGLVLIAEDVPFARRICVDILDKVERHRPEWLRRKRKK